MSLNADKIVNLDFYALPAGVQKFLLAGSAATPPQGVTANFSNPSNQNALGTTVIVTGVVLVATTGLVRLYSRFLTKTWKIEDLLGLIAFMCYVVMLYCIVTLMRLVGFFVDQWNVRLQTFVDCAVVVYIYPMVYSASMLFAKNAILFEWSRIFVPAGTRNAFFWFTRVLIVANTMLYFAGIIAGVFMCKPIAKSWDFFIHGECLDRRQVHGSMVCFNLAIDLFILILPQKVIWSLQMTRSRRLGVSIIFSIGLMGLACAAGHTYSNMLGYGYKGSNTTMMVSNTFLWSFSEVSCTLMVFFVPAMPKVFRSTDHGFFSKIASNLRSWGRGSSSRLRTPKESKASDTQASWGNVYTGHQASFGGGTQMAAETPSEWAYPVASHTSDPAMSQTDVELVHSKAVELDYQNPIIQPPWNAGIVKTTEFRRNEEEREAAPYQPPQELGVGIDRHRPWMDRNWDGSPHR
ncbi:hypothetical protein B0H63DRAFT_103002 [Podospora didyma]|uniref:Rhodopsin domain-containing protein n=1 Tax=Podospora didyma TaxID=330526 RepID=A0AAE0U3X6_9PEZI|nr:hypothetical protein B0H63DRAFT_103002 [Podospora didyma]